MIQRGGEMEKDMEKMKKQPRKEYTLKRGIEEK